MDTFLRIGELARRTGASTHALRVWEDRYQLLDPQRSANGYRLYTSEDERCVRAMLRLRSEGVGAAVAAGRVLGAALRGSGPQDLDEMRADLLAAFSSYDDKAAHAVIDAAFVWHPVDEVLDRFLFPCLKTLGEAWAADEITVAQEHYASGLIRGRMLALAAELGPPTPATGQDAPPSAVLACTPHEHHDIALLGLNLMLRAGGWQVTFLGADTPVQSSAGLAEDLGADVLVLCGTEPHMFAAQLEQHSDVLVSLLTSSTVALGGRAASLEVAERLGSLLLPDNAVEAAEELTSRHRRVSVGGGR